MQKPLPKARFLFNGISLGQIVGLEPEKYCFSGIEPFVLVHYITKNRENIAKFGSHIKAKHFYFWPKASTMGITIL